MKRFALFLLLSLLAADALGSLTSFTKDLDGFSTYVQGSSAAFSSASGKIWVLGGWNMIEYEVFKKSVYSCTPPSNPDSESHNWTRLADFDTPDGNGIWNAAQNTVSIGDLILMTSGNYAGLIHAYNTATDTFHFNYTEIPSALQYSSLCKSADDKQLFVTGGNMGVDSFYVMDVATKSWGSGPPMNEKRALHACAVFEEYLYVFGGNTTSVERVNTSKVADSQWTTLSSAAVQYADYGTKALRVERNIYLIAGTGVSDTSDLVQVFDVDSETIAQSSATLAESTSRGSAVVTADNRLYHIGGMMQNGYVSNYVQYSNSITETAEETTQSPTQASEETSEVPETSQSPQTTATGLATPVTTEDDSGAEKVRFVYWLFPFAICVMW